MNRGEKGGWLVIGGRGMLGRVDDEGGEKERVLGGQDRISFINWFRSHTSISGGTSASFRHLQVHGSRSAPLSRILHSLLRNPQSTLYNASRCIVLVLRSATLIFFREYRAASTVTGCIIQRMQLSLDSLLTLWPHLRPRQTDERVIPW